MLLAQLFYLSAFHTAAPCPRPNHIVHIRMQNYSYVHTKVGYLTLAFCASPTEVVLPMDAFIKTQLVTDGKSRRKHYLQVFSCVSSDIFCVASTPCEFSALYYSNEIEGDVDDKVL